MCTHLAVPAHYGDATSWLCACVPLRPALPIFKRQRERPPPREVPVSVISRCPASRHPVRGPFVPALGSARDGSGPALGWGWGGAFLEPDTPGFRLQSQTVGAAVLFPRAWPSPAERPLGLPNARWAARGHISRPHPRKSLLGVDQRVLRVSPLARPGSRGRDPPAMENENSRIPVYSFHHPTTPFPSKKQRINKTVEPEFSKDPNFTFSSNVPEDGVFKAKNQGLCRSTKKVEPLSKKTATTARGPLSRYRLETELKTKNQLLEIAKQQLHSKLAGAQGTIKDLREKNEVLEEEVQKLKKFQDNCMVILESRNIDPVTGNEILEEEDTKECQKQTMLLTEKLKEELRLFSQMAEKQEELLTATAMWKLAENDRNNFLEKQASFQREIEEYAATVGQVELLLDI
uniref:Small kinetochore-associated protein n=1 Tax=Chrysemys picta bellii TaxID=8478 RepID=A0A8C3HIX0_CHRPI